jgi:hypothetical protein
VEGETELEPKPKLLVLELDLVRELDCEAELEEVAAWPGWLARAKRTTPRKPAAADAAAICLAPAARRRAASILVMPQAGLGRRSEVRSRARIRHGPGRRTSARAGPAG